MKKHEVIKIVEETTGVYSCMKIKNVSCKLLDYLKTKNITKVFEDVLYISEENNEIIQTERVIFWFNRGGYIDIKNKNSKCSIKLYYKPSNSDEIILFVKQLLKDFKNEFNNN